MPAVQRRTVLSEPAEASIFPSGEKTTVKISPCAPPSRRSSLMEGTGLALASTTLTGIFEGPARVGAGKRSTRGSSRQSKERRFNIENIPEYFG